MRSVWHRERGYTEGKLYKGKGIAVMIPISITSLKKAFKRVKNLFKTE